MNKDTTVELRTGNTIPILGLGTWNLMNDTSGTIAYALELGYPMIDTSSDYRTQPEIGEGIKKSQLVRESIFITTKIEETDDAYARTLSNLKELDISYVDLMLIHRPPISSVGEELWQGLIRAKKEGLVKDIGVSNYSIDMIEELVDLTGEVPVVNQIEWSPFGHSDQMLKYCEERNIVIQAYSPLTRSKRLNEDMLLLIAEKYDKSPAQILIRWNLQQRTVPIIKANTRSHLEENIAVFDFALSEEDMRVINNLNENFSSLGTLQYL